MKKKQYIVPDVEIMLYQMQNLMKVGSETPDDPGTSTSAPARRVPTLGNDSVKAF